MKKYEMNGEQLALSLVKEESGKRVPRKRVDIVSLRLVRERSLMYRCFAICCANLIIQNKQLVDLNYSHFSSRMSLGT